MVTLPSSKLLFFVFYECSEDVGLFHQTLRLRTGGKLLQSLLNYIQILFASLCLSSQQFFFPLQKTALCYFHNKSPREEECKQDVSQQDRNTNSCYI